MIDLKRLKEVGVEDLCRESSFDEVRIEGGDVG